MENYISYGIASSYSLAIQGIPPSQLGFVCKPDMPPHINILFRARPAMPFIRLPEKGHTWKYDGVFSEKKDILDLVEKSPPPKKDDSESKHIRRIKAIAEKIELQKAVNKEKIKQWAPKDYQNATTDPYKTLFIYKLDKKTDEKKLKKEFEIYGPLKAVRIIRELNGNSRGYAFVEFEHKSDFKNAYKRAERKKIDGNKVMVDYERGRTEKNWKPRRLGGGRGDSRALPYWMENEIKEIKKLYPEISVKYEKETNEEEIYLREKRERSREKSIDQGEKKKSKRSKSKSTGEKEKAKKEKKCTIESNPFITSKNITESEPVPEDEEDKQTIKAEDSISSEERSKKRKKEKKERKEKKEKKEKKDKKAEKREKEKGNSEVEIGEIVA